MPRETKQSVHGSDSQAFNHSINALLGHPWTFKALTSILLLLLPLLLHPLEVPNCNNWQWNNNELLVALLAMGIELVAFFWLAAWPLIRFCVKPSIHFLIPADRAAFFHFLGRAWDRIVLVSAPLLALFLPFDGWANGYRSLSNLPTAGSFMFLALCLGLLFPGVLVRFLKILISRRWPRVLSAIYHAAATLSLFTISLYAVPIYHTTYCLGQARLEAEMDFEQLGEECLRIQKENGLILQRPFTSSKYPMIRRLKPRSINPLSHGVYIELHGGFDHYGYEFAKNEESNEWVLSWCPGSGPHTIKGVYPASPK